MKFFEKLLTFFKEALQKNSDEIEYDILYVGVEKQEPMTVVDLFEIGQRWKNDYII